MHMGGEARQDGTDDLGTSTGVLARVRVCVRVDKRVHGFRTALTRASRRKTLGGESVQDKEKSSTTSSERDGRSGGLDGAR
jgi:hypothetical protein